MNSNSLPLVQRSFIFFALFIAYVIILAVWSSICSNTKFLSAFNTAKFAESAPYKAWREIILLIVFLWFTSFVPSTPASIPLDKETIGFILKLVIASLTLGDVFADSLRTFISKRFL